MRTIPKKRATFFVTVLFVSVCLLTDFLPLPAWAGKDINTIEAKAKLGDANFEAILGLIYADGKEVPQNYTKAAYWFRLSANQGNAIAQLLLGLFYEKGQGVPQNAAKAKYWYRLAANQGNAQAQFFLGFVYYKGNSFPKNYTKSAYWFHLAANQGISRAQTILGVQYEDGQGVPQSYYKADQWYRLAANQGNSTAQLFLGLNFFHGRGVPQNYEKAYKWLLLSRSRGGKMMVAASKIEFDQLKSLMTHGQIAEAQRLAGEWTAVNAKNESRLRKLQPQISDTPLITKKVILRYNSPVDHPSFNLPKHQSWYAVVVGVEQYPKGIPRAKFSKRDAQAVKANLIALGYPESHIRLLTNDQATDTRIQVTLKNWLPRNVPQGGRVLFYFAGHGGTDPASKTAYLVPFDGDPEDLPDTALSVGEIEQDIGKLPLSRGIIVADACFSGEGGRSVLPKGARPLITVFRTPYPDHYKNLTVFGASEGNQISGDLPIEGHGIFTYYFLRGLEGKAKTGNAVTPKSLKRYLSRTVPLAFRHHYNSGEQNPVISGDMNGVLVKY